MALGTSANCSVARGSSLRPCVHTHGGDGGNKSPLESSAGTCNARVFSPLSAAAAASSAIASATVPTATVRPSAAASTLTASRELSGFDHPSSGWRTCCIVIIGIDIAPLQSNSNQTTNIDVKDVRFGLPVVSVSARSKPATRSQNTTHKHIPT